MPKLSLTRFIHEPQKHSTIYLQVNQNLLSFLSKMLLSVDCVLWQDTK